MYSPLLKAYMCNLVVCESVLGYAILAKCSVAFSPDDKLALCGLVWR
jgi:hypothetical protein